MTNEYGKTYRRFLENQRDTGTHGQRQELPWDNATAFPGDYEKGQLPEATRGQTFPKRVADIRHGGPTNG
jgi:hypothetical protein